MLSTEDESRLEKNLVWIFASRRSGTTWLAKELLSFQTQCMDEPLIGLHLGVFRQTENKIVRTIDMRSDRPDYFFSKSNFDTTLFFLRKLILNRIYAQFKNLDKIIIKEPSGSVAADIIAKCLPHSKIIILLRDARDVLDSNLDANSVGGWETKAKKGTRTPFTNKNRISYIKKSANFWIFQTELLMKTYEQHSENLRYLLRYEELLKNTNEELKKLYKFLGIDIDDDILNKIVNKYSFENIPEEKKGKHEFRRFASPGKWKENFNEEEKKLMNDLLEVHLHKLGY